MTRLALTLLCVALDYGIGANNDGVIYTHWNRWVAPGEGTRFGLSDTTQSFFFSPAKPTSWGGFRTGPSRRTSWSRRSSGPGRRS